MKPFFVRCLLAVVGAAAGALLGFYAVALLGAFTGAIGMCMAPAAGWWASVYFVLWPLGPLAGALGIAWPLVRWHYRRGLHRSAAKPPNHALQRTPPQGHAGCSLTPQRPPAAIAPLLRRR